MAVMAWGAVYSCTHMTTVGVKGLKLTTAVWQSIHEMVRHSVDTSTDPFGSTQQWSADENASHMSPSSLLANTLQRAWYVLISVGANVIGICSELLGPSATFRWDFSRRVNGDPPPLWSTAPRPNSLSAPDTHNTLVNGWSGFTQ